MKKISPPQLSFFMPTKLELRNVAVCMARTANQKTAISEKIAESNTVQRDARAGFTLIEVTLAIGIVSFALLALLGMLPIGIMTVQESMQQTARSHILQQISGDLGMLHFQQLPDYLSAPQYYNYEGKRLEGDSGAIFVVNLTTAAASYPGSTNSTDLTDRLQRVTVSIHRTGESETAAFRTSLSAFNSSGAL